jgi:hypothetical protein
MLSTLVNFASDWRRDASADVSEGRGCASLLAIKEVERAKLSVIALIKPTTIIFLFFMGY